MSQPQPACALSRAAVANIIRARTGRGWTQQRLAEAAMLSQGMIGLLETGQRNLTLPTLEKLAWVLGVEAADLLRADVKDAATREAG
jgi:transcriptional regulator with XRE-family HTH domain